MEKFLLHEALENIVQGFYIFIIDHSLVNFSKIPHKCYQSFSEIDHNFMNLCKDDLQHSHYLANSPNKSF